MKRFTEASTWAGIGVLFQVLAGVLPVDLQIYMHGVSAVAGALAGVIAEKGIRQPATTPTTYPRLFQ